MKPFKIPVTYEMHGYITIWADNKDDAIDMAWQDDIPLPHNADYIQGSWNVEEQYVEEIKEK